MEPLEFRDATAWDTWLETHHDDRSEAWLRIAKKRSPLTLVTIGDALDVALCHGWIDGQRTAYDEGSFLQRYSPRRPTSSWSKINVDKAEALIDAGRMHPAGLAAIAAAKADGRWDAAYTSQRSAAVPDELASALRANASAETAFGRLDRSSRYALMLPLLKARTDATRARAITRIIDRLTTPP